MDPVSTLGVHLSADSGTIGVWSQNAERIELCVFDERDPGWLIETTALTRGDGDIWSATTNRLRPGVRYALRVSGPQRPQNAFEPEKFLLDPYGRGIVGSDSGSRRSVVIDDSFDWDGAVKPNTPLDRSVVYETHVKGISKLNPRVPAELRGTYAGLAHPATIEHLTDLGITAVELLPVHAFASEDRLVKQGLVNYWGYNSLNYFSPHPAYATKAAQAAGADAVVREFKGMVKLLHEAGLEVILDVVYNHTAEEGRGGPTTSLRGIDNASYYRQNADGDYIDYTGVGNTVNSAHQAAQRLIVDSLRYWTNDVQIDGFRFDLAATLGRDASGEYTRRHPLLDGIVDDPLLENVKTIAEPWDVGPGGWQTGNFPDGWSEWNDRYRDRVRTFWLRDIADARIAGQPSTGIGSFATRLAGSSNTFALERGPVASLNFISAHDGFTAADLVAFDTKHNLGNGEENRDGSDDNRSFNHGAEGDTTDETILHARRKAVRNLLGTLLFSAGVPMITAGDEFGRSQNGNNNAYCHDSELTWLDWGRDVSQHDLFSTVRRLIELRRENPALRPIRYGVSGESVPHASQMEWYDAAGSTMSVSDWQSPENRTLQYLVASTPEFEEFNRILLIVHGLETDVEVTLPQHDDVATYALLWDSAHETPLSESTNHAPGSTVHLTPTSMQLYRTHPAS